MLKFIASQSRKIHNGNTIKEELYESTEEIWPGRRHLIRETIFCTSGEVLHATEILSAKGVEDFMAEVDKFFAEAGV